MGCFPCFESSKRKKLHPNSPSIISALSSGSDRIAAQTFSFSEITTAARNFSPECLMGEGEFGCLFKGTLLNGQVVAFKHFNSDVYQGNREFLVDVQMLSRLHHPNLVNLIGYCADGDHRFLVYEFTPLGYLDDHLHYLQSDEEPLDWNTRMNIAAGAAKGLEYLHDKANPPFIHQNLKLSNILLGEEYSPKLSDFGHVKLGPARQMYKQDTHGYSAPEYLMTGQLTVKSDIYSFGVFLLELITGRKAIDYNQPFEGRNLVAWARPLFNDRINFAKLADSRLQGKFPVHGLYEAVVVASMCIQENPAARPPISTLVTALSYLMQQITVNMPKFLEVLFKVVLQYRDILPSKDVPESSTISIFNTRTRHMGGTSRNPQGPNLVFLICNRSITQKFYLILGSMLLFQLMYGR